MDEFLKKLTTELNQICPAFLQVPFQTPYPYITVEADTLLQGLPWGPSMAIVSVKIWSRYTGIQEVLKFAKAIEELLSLSEWALKILESTLVMLNDGQTRVHTFRLKTRLSRDL